jgi:hypothetical protein
MGFNLSELFLKSNLTSNFSDEARHSAFRRFTVDGCGRQSGPEGEVEGGSEPSRRSQRFPLRNG